jgi:GH15 family glucan-1,4-alpha-glucosidase
MLLESYEVLDRLRKHHGLYVASPSEHYRYVWIRDSVYMSLPYLNKRNAKYERTYYRLLDLFREYEWKLDILCRERPQAEWEYLHARYSAEDVREIHEVGWGHVQHDMIGAFLFGLAAGAEQGKRMLRDRKDREIVQKLVAYLANVEYWQDPDNGMWEEWREVHASSVGACAAGLAKLKQVRLAEVPEELIQKGMQALYGLFPRESQDKAADLAQLSLIYPYRAHTGEEGRAIVKRVEQQLLRQRGVIRYAADSYYSTLEEKYGRGLPQEQYLGTEAEWTFGLPWLALCHLVLGNMEEARDYLERTEAVMVKPGVLPELYYSGTDRANPNTPLGWSSAMYILAKEALDETDLTVAGGF